MSASPELTGTPPPAELAGRLIATFQQPPFDNLSDPDPPSTKLAKRKHEEEEEEKEEEEEEEEKDQLYRTPTREEVRIPKVAKACPLAPRKPRRQVLRCKRRLFETELMEVGSEELQQLFRPREFPWPTYVVSDVAVAKKRKSM